MRFPVAAVIAALGTVTASAQEAPAVPVNRCAPLVGKLTATAPFAPPQLFILEATGWKEISYNWFGTDYVLASYGGGKLSFIYVVPPSDVRNRQFLSIRSVADTIEHDDFVNLRRHHEQFDTVYTGTYEDYHASGNTSATLRRFHRWPNGERSDAPPRSRESWAFQTTKSVARHRVLAISYRAAESTVCVPFVLGPNIAISADETEGDDEITILKGFVVEITEAKTVSGSSGRTFKIRSPVMKAP